MRSHSTPQQYGSTAQTLVAHGLQLPSSGSPAVQTPCEQVAPLPEHWPLGSQIWPVGHRPQKPPQPSLPQVRPEQSGMQKPPEVHWPLGSQNWPAVHWPQKPPHPSKPQVLPLQSGVQVELDGEHWPLLSHVWPLPHEPQEPPHASSPHTLPVHSGVQAGVPPSVTGAEPPYST